MKRLLCTTALALTIGAAHADGGYHRPAAKAAAVEPTHHHSNYYVKAEVGKSWMKSFKGGIRKEPTTALGYHPDYINGKPKNNLTYGLAVGYKFDNSFRADINAQFRKLNYSNMFDLENGTDEVNQNQKIKNYSVFVNGYYDFSVNTLTPYVTLGVGYACNKSGDLTSIFTDLPDGPKSFKATGKGKSSFAWNAGVGTLIKLNNSLDLDLAYRYLDLGKAAARPTKLIGGGSLANPQGDDVTLSKQAVRAHQVTVGLIYKF
jgi:opacity protein-like surface antigen